MNLRKNGTLQPLFRSRQLSLKIHLSFVLSLLLGRANCFALPPEGFESFAVIGAGTAATSLTTAIGFVNPRWVGDYQSFNFYAGTTTYSAGYVTVGGALTVGNDFADRNAYFIRHDFLFLPTVSLSLKLLHEDLRFIPSGHDSIGLEVNSFIPWSGISGLYFSVGLFNKWNKFEWNGPYWLPFYYNTNDSYAFFTGVFGLKFALGQKNFWTVDASTREPFTYHSLDHMGFEGTLNLALGQNSYFRVITGLRTSAFFMGTMTPASYHFMLGLASQ